MDPHFSKTMQGNQMKFETLMAGNSRKCKAHYPPLLDETLNQGPVSL